MHIDLFLAVALLFWAFFQIFLYCEFGERLMERFDEIEDEVFNWSWYKMPLNIQKMLPIIINGIQQPVGLTGFGGIRCTREAFQNVGFLVFNE